MVPVPVVPLAGLGRLQEQVPAVLVVAAMG
jgi:hypothetical protein